MPELRRAADRTFCAACGQRDIPPYPLAYFVLASGSFDAAVMFYRKRKYPEHLCFAIHLHAFILTIYRVSITT